MRRPGQVPDEVNRSIVRLLLPVKSGVSSIEKSKFHVLLVSVALGEYDES